MTEISQSSSVVCEKVQDESGMIFFRTKKPCEQKEQSTEESRLSIQIFRDAVCEKSEDESDCLTLKPELFTALSSLLSSEAYSHWLDLVCPRLYPPSIHIDVMRKSSPDSKSIDMCAFLSKAKQLLISFINNSQIEFDMTLCCLGYCELVSHAGKSVPIDRPII